MGLIDNLNEIKRQKDEYIIPENIKKDITVYGVTGTLEEGDNFEINNGAYLFYNSARLDILNSLLKHINNITDTQYMFYLCTSLTEIPLLDTSNVTNMQQMFTECTNLTSIPLLDTSKVTNMGSIFYNCNKLTTIPLLDTSKVTNMNSMFSGCKALTSLPQLDLSSVTQLGGTFYNCISLTSIDLDFIPSFNIVTSMGYMFQNCSKLENISFGNIDNINRATDVNSFAGTFNNCPKLNNETLNRILKLLPKLKPNTASTLKAFGLSSTQATICQTLSNYQDFIDAGWSTGY